MQSRICHTDFFFSKAVCGTLALFTADMTGVFADCVDNNGFLSVL